MSLYDQKAVRLQYHSEILLLRPCALRVRVILIIHPGKARIILVTTDLKLSALAVYTRNKMVLLNKHFKIDRKPGGMRVFFKIQWGKPLSFRDKMVLEQGLTGGFREMTHNVKNLSCNTRYVVSRASPGAGP